MKRIITLLLVALCILAGCGPHVETDYPAAIMVNGEVYYKSVMQIAGEIDESAILGYTESYTDTYPEKDGETNFNRELGMPYAKVEEGIAVLMNEEWYMCYPKENNSPIVIIYEGPLSCVTHHSGWGRMSLMDMTEEFHKKVLELLNGGTWLNDVTKCESDYEFETKNEKITYHSECGTFIDVTNQRSLTLSDEEQAEINRMLGAK